jgi:hypothetical protein
MLTKVVPSINYRGKVNGKAFKFKVCTQYIHYPLCRRIWDTVGVPRQAIDVECKIINSLVNEFKNDCAQ